MHFLRKELAAIILLLSVTLFLSSYSEFVAEGKAISRMPSWATWAGVPWDVTTGETLVSASYQDGKAVVTASGTYIWTTGYIWNPRARQWQRFTFPHNTEYPGWSSNEVIAEIPVETGSLISGDNYVLAYTCQWKNERWYCGCLNAQSGADGALLSCGRWQLQTFTKAPDRSCFDFKTSSQCNANRNLGSNVECEWTEFPSRAPVCVAYSGSCSDLGENDCKNSQYQNFKCSWENNKCINVEYRSVRRTSESSQNTMSGFVTGMTVDDADTSYCPGFLRDFTMVGLYSREWREECPEGCVAYGGVSSPLYCTFPGRYYTKGDVAAIRSQYTYSDSTNRCAFSYCECISGGSDNANCNRFHSRTSSGGYYRTAGESNGCVWQGESAGGFCIASESANTRAGRSSVAREGRVCEMEGTLQMQGNTCFVCAGTEGWTKIDEKTDIAEFTICETHQTGRLQRDMTTALVDKAEFERHNPQPGSRDPQLSELYRQEIIKNTYRDDANYQREARERVEDALAESGDERESFDVPSPDNIDPEFGLLVEETALREDAGTLSAGTRKKFHEWLNSNIAFFSSSIFYRYDPSERKVSFFSAGARDCPEENIRVVPNEIIRADGTYVRTDDTKVCLLDIELRNPSGVIDDSLLSRTAFTLDEITEMISEIRRKEGSFGIIPETDSIPENQFLEVGLRELRQFKVLLDRGVLSDATVVSTEGERLDVSKLPAMRSYFQAADYVRNSDMTTTEKMNVIYPIIHSMANNEYDSERFEDENPETFTYMWSEMILPQETVAGICRDKSMLYATLLRYAGIDAQIQAGYIPFAIKNPVDLTIGDLKLAKLNPGAHAWIKINTPECSFEIDPTWYNDTSSYVPVHRVTDECEE